MLCEEFVPFTENPPGHDTVDHERATFNEFLRRLPAREYIHGAFSRVREGTRHKEDRGTPAPSMVGLLLITFLILLFVAISILLFEERCTGIIPGNQYRERSPI